MAYSFDSRIRYSEVDAACRLSLTGLTNYFQDCSVFHSQSHDVGISFLADNHIAWVLSSWQICINKLPLLNEQVRISTWAYGMKAFYGYRNFKMEDADGNLLAYANSVWVLVNTQTGRPVKVPQEFADTYGLEPQLEMDCAKRKIQIPDDMKTQAKPRHADTEGSQQHQTHRGRLADSASDLLPRRRALQTNPRETYRFVPSRQWSSTPSSVHR